MSKLPDFEGSAMFAKVAEERSFAAAARTMGVSVATVSRAVTRLEERLGGRLFSRTSRRLALTDYGHALAERASRIFHGRGGRRGFRARGLQPSAGPGETRGPAVVRHALGRAAAAGVFRRYPDIAIDLHLTDAQTDLIGDRLRRGAAHCRAGGFIGRHA